MILGVITSNNVLLPIGFVESLLNVASYTRIWQKGPSIPDNRNKVFEQARVMGEDLLFIDSDMVFTLADVRKVEEHLKTHDIIAGAYRMAFPNAPLSIFDKDMKETQLQDSPFQIGACGAGFLGISKRVLDTLTEPFTPLLFEKTGQYYGEDISFCLRAREQGFTIMCDPSVNLGHIKTNILWTT